MAEEDQVYVDGEAEPVDCNVVANPSAVDDLIVEFSVQVVDDDIRLSAVEAP